MKRILITGAAGFIGFHLASTLQKRGDFCLGIDNFNPYYDPSLKKARASLLKKQGVEVLHADICDQEKLKLLLFKHGITHLVHLAAQAGVRHSLSDPNQYVRDNLQGFVSLLEALKSFSSIKLIFASSSSVYGGSKKIPFHESDPTDSPTNLYGATKKANETLAYSYHHLYGIDTAGLRYFTVYGPWGRPDMAYYRFTKQILHAKPIQVFNGGEMERDFTYIDDIVQGTLAAIDRVSGYEIFNLGNHQKVGLLHLIDLLEEALGKKAIRQMLPMQQGEVLKTFADIQKAKDKLGFCPSTPLRDGILKFTEWFKQYHGLSKHLEMQLA